MKGLIEMIGADDAAARNAFPERRWCQTTPAASGAMWERAHIGRSALRVILRLMAAGRASATARDGIRS
ncbi:MAG: hypothetical protein KAH46_31345, partial [Mycobacterium sp.]|nr:hypothetical protein [Mycobacterium sp.]